MAKKNKRRAKLKINYNNLIVAIKVKGKVIYGKILWQREYLRRPDMSVKTPEGFTVVSYSHPALTDNYLYIRGGHRRSDYARFKRSYSTNEAAVEAAKRLARAIGLVNSIQAPQSRPTIDCPKGFTKVMWGNELG